MATKQYLCQAGNSSKTTFHKSFVTDSLKEAVDWCKDCMDDEDMVDISVVRILEPKSNDNFVVVEYKRMWVLTSTG